MTSRPSPMKKRARADQSLSDLCARPLQPSEHVLCTLQPDVSGPLLAATVVTLDDCYQAAARRFYANSHSPNDPYSPVPANIIDLEADDSLEMLHPRSPAQNRPCNTILFREAQDHAAKRSTNSPSSTPLKRKREDVHSPNPLYDSPRSPPKPSDRPSPHPISVGRVYVHFTGRDRRLDRWVSAAELQRAPASLVVAAESGVAQNILVDNATQAKYAVVDVPNNDSRKLTRSRRRAYEEFNPVSEREEGNEAIAHMERVREENTKVRNISSIVFGQYSVDAWYFSPYPGRYGCVKTLYICGYCLMYVRSSSRYVKHCSTCTWENPPGKMIYNDPENEVCVYEVDGLLNPGYCERLCLLGKLFLDHKTLYFDVAPFLFYLVTVSNDLAGFFSKEKPQCESEYNLACILTLPQHQRKGIGRFLIALSYELSKREGKIGGPERPLSDLGQLSYRSYWCYEIVQFLRTRRDRGQVSPADIAKATGIQCPDIVAALKSLNLVSIWKAETYADTRKDFDQIEERISAPTLPLDPSRLRFTPYKSSITRVRKRQKKQSPKAPSTPANGSTDHIPADHERRQDGRSPFSPYEIHRMSMFIQKHSAEKVAASMNTPGGISSRMLSDFADELSMATKRCRKKLRRMALQMLSDDHALNMVRPRSPRKVNGMHNRLQPLSHEREHNGSPNAVVKHERKDRGTTRLSVCNELELVEMVPAHSRLAPRMSGGMHNTEVVVIDPSPSSCE